ncbi:hypothetical protein Mapa_000390 [Marchantia paleacea]|nr:hypothetical protein Mapa_000390 [Marchantia paleacea]
MSSSSSFEDQPTIKKINDALYEFYKPASGCIAMNIIFFHGLHGPNTEDAYKRTWMLADDSACWLNTLLPQEFPNARILSASYDSCVDVLECNGRMDMYLVGENLVQSIIRLGGMDRSCPVVLVGHCVGGLVLKEVCVRADQMGAMNDCPLMNPCKTFLKNMKGAFFYSTSGSGLRAENDLDNRGPLLRYLSLLNKEATRLNSDFSKLRNRYRWTTFGVSEASETEDFRKLIRPPNLISRLFSRKPPVTVVVEEGSARPDMDGYCVLPGEDCFTICKPKDKKSSSFQLLVNFVQDILNVEEAAEEQCKSSLHLPRIYVNMPTRVEMMIEQLRIEDDEYSRIAMVGMGGIGKSTLAKEILLQIRHQFDFIGFVASVKERLARHDLHHLVTENLYYGSGRKVWLQDGDVQSMWLLLRGKKVFLVMDDVDSEELIRPLLKSDWCARGSRLIVTSRVHSQESLPTFVLCKVPFLSVPESVALFYAHMTQEHEIVSQDLVAEVIAKCDGLPLTLEVIGSYLSHETREDVWISTLNKLTRAEPLNGSVNDRLWSKLRVSFDELASAETRMFLDLAVLDNCDPQVPHYDLAIWKSLWKRGIDGSTLASGLRNLEERSFIVLENYAGESAMEVLQNFTDKSSLNTYGLSCNVTKVQIHQQLRDMGKSMSRPHEMKIELCRSVWQPDDIDYILQEYKGDQALTEILSVPLTVKRGRVPTTSPKEYRWSSISQLRELRFLRMSAVCLLDNNAQRFPSKLALLHLTSCWRGPTRKFWFLRDDNWPIREEDVNGLDFLTVLLLDNCNAVNLPSNFHRLKNLNILIICGISTVKLPQEFGRLPALEFLFLDNIGISKLPDSFLQLSSLQSFTLRGCSKLKAWPAPKAITSVENVSSPLCRITTLRLEDLPSLAELPESFGLMNSLEKLEIIGCSALKHLPEGFRGLQKLEHLDIEGCDKLESLCESFGELRHLTWLCIDFCPSLRRLPVSIGNLGSLISLFLQELSIVSLPESIGRLDKLLKFGISRMENLMRLPDSLENLPMLGVIEIISCIRLTTLPDSIGRIRNLRSMFVMGCPSLQSLPNSIGQLGSLEMFTLRHCRRIRFLPDSFGQLKSLRHLELEGCEGMQRLPDTMGRLQALHTINIVGEENLEKLPDSLAELKSLRNVYVPMRLRTIPLQVEYLSHFPTDAILISLGYYVR